MHRIAGFGLFLLSVSSPILHATEVVDRFDSADNPDGWSFSGSDPVFGAGIVTDGGNPGGWLDSGDPLEQWEPRVGSLGPPGSALRAALASGKLRTASIDFERLAPTAAGCAGPGLSKSFSLSLTDLHSGKDAIHGLARLGPASPSEFYPWRRATFVIQSDAATTPRGWKLINAPAGYTWADLMHNIDGIEFYAMLSPFAESHSCYHFGADNIVITYGDVDAIFIADFDSGIDDSNLVADPGFEGTLSNGGVDAAWKSADLNPGANGATLFYRSGGTGIVPHTGDVVAWFGGWPSHSEIQYIAQSVTLPAGGPLYLNYFRKTTYAIDSTEMFHVLIDGTPMETTDLSTIFVLETDYVPHSIDISLFADGRAHEVRFEYDFDAAFANSDGSTFVDDVTIDATPITTRN